MRCSGNFFRNKDGAIAIEFAACFCLFSALLFIIYDVYATIMLQNRLERANYTVASLFRERSAMAILPIMNNYSNRLCQSNPNYCFSSYEVFDDRQVQELGQLATSLLGGRDVSIQVDALFILQNTNYEGDINNAELVTLSSKYCPFGACNNKINNYFNSLPSMDDNSNTTSNYSKLVPYTKRVLAPVSGLEGRWIPLYRVSLCIVNEESLYLKWINSSRDVRDTFPNLCSNTVVVSRCNNIADPDGVCPIYGL